MRSTPQAKQANRFYQTPIMTTVSDSAGRRSRKKLPSIPPEELALHGKTGSLDAGSKHHDLPPEVQAQFIRHVHKRSRSLTGLDTFEFERLRQVEAEKENVEPITHQQNVVVPKLEQLIAMEEENAMFARSLPSTPGMLENVLSIFFNFTNMAMGHRT